MTNHNARLNYTKLTDENKEAFWLQHSVAYRYEQRLVKLSEIMPRGEYGILDGYPRFKSIETLMLQALNLLYNNKYIAFQTYDNEIEKQVALYLEKFSVIE